MATISLSVLEELTDQEIKILTLLARGHSASEVGIAVELSVRTVENKILQLTRRFKAKNKTELCCAWLVTAHNIQNAVKLLKLNVKE